MTDATNDGGADLAARLDQIASELAGLAGRSAPPPLPPEIVGLPAQMDAIGSSMTEIRVHLGSLGNVDDRLDRVEELVIAIAHQVAKDAQERSAAPEPSAATDASLAEIEGALARLSGSVEPLSASVGATQDRLASISTSIQALARATDEPAGLAALAEGMGARIDRLTADLSERITASAPDLAERLAPQIVAAVAEVPAVLAELLGSFTDEVRQAASSAAASAGVAAAEASITAAEAAGEAILADQDLKFTALSERLVGAIDISISRHAEGLGALNATVASTRSSLEGLVETSDGMGETLAGIAGSVEGIASSMVELRSSMHALQRLPVTIDALSSSVHDFKQAQAGMEAKVEAAIRAALHDVGDRFDRSENALTPEIAAIVMETGREAFEAATQSLVSAALASLERGSMSAQADVERATESALDALLAAIDARLTTAAQAGGPAVTLEAIGELIDTAAGSIAETAAGAAADHVRGVGAQTAADAARAASQAASAAMTSAATESAAETARSVADLVAAEVERITAETVSASVHDAVEAAIEGSIAPTLRSAGRAIAAAAADAAGEAVARSAVDADAIAEGAAGPLNDAVASIEETVRQALSVRASAHRPPEGQEMTAAMMSAVAASLDEFAMRVEGDLDRMGSRLAALAEVLENLVEENAARRRNAGGGTVALLRQVAAESGTPPKARRRTAKRGTG